MNQIRLNATSIGDFKACPQRFRLKHIEKLSPVEDADTLRMGTNWHKLHEIAANAIDKENSVIAALNTAYEKMPASKTVEEWGVEREILLRSFLVYQGYWANNPFIALASEQKFELPLNHPRLGVPIHPKLAVITGRMDQIVLHEGKVCVLERKSTSSDIAPDADYWQMLRKNEQVSIYALALRKILRHSEGWVDGYDFSGGYVPAQAVNGVMPRPGNTVYDVWRKPQIEPKNLTQEASAEFVQSGTYFGEVFGVCAAPIGFTVNGETAVVTPGKKEGTFAIRETVAMYGARLQSVMSEEPTRYFARREIARTVDEIAAYEREIFAVYTAMRAFEQESCYFSNPNHCKSPYPCEYIPVCYGPGAESVTNNSEPPAGFKRTHLPILKT